MIRVAIVEDEKIYRKQLKNHLKRFQDETGQTFKIAEFADGEDIVDDYDCSFDIIFLDIQMRFMDGMEAARNIRKVDSSVTIIFITNMIQYAIQGYQVNALDYIVKPVEYFALRKKLESLVEKLEEKSRCFIQIPLEEGAQRIEVSSIYYVESRGHMLHFITKQGDFVTRGVLKKFEELLTPYGFFSCSKGVLINMERVDGIRENVCIVHGNMIPVSRRKKKYFLDEMLKFIDEVV